MKVSSLPNGGFIVGWLPEGVYELHWKVPFNIRSFKSGSWEPITQIPGAKAVGRLFWQSRNFISLKSDSIGNVVAAWMDVNPNGNVWTIQSSAFIGGSWTTPRALDDTTLANGTLFPSVESTGANSFIAIWSIQERDTYRNTFQIVEGRISNNTLSISKSGNGTITSNPAGINCGGDCSENYTSGTNVTLTVKTDS
jgi:hypothetical protein